MELLPPRSHPGHPEEKAAARVRPGSPRGLRTAALVGPGLREARDALSARLARGRRSPGPPTPRPAQGRGAQRPALRKAAGLAPRAARAPLGPRRPGGALRPQ